MQTFPILINLGSGMRSFDSSEPILAKINIFSGITNYLHRTVFEKIPLTEYAPWQNVLQSPPPTLFTASWWFWSLVTGGGSLVTRGGSLVARGGSLVAGGLKSNSGEVHFRKFVLFVCLLLHFSAPLLPMGNGASMGGGARPPFCLTYKVTPPTVHKTY